MNVHFLNTFEIETAKAATYANKTKNKKQNKRSNDFLNDIQQVKIIKNIFNA